MEQTIGESKEGRGEETRRRKGRESMVIPVGNRIFLIVCRRSITWLALPYPKMRFSGRGRSVIHCTSKQLAEKWIQRKRQAFLFQKRLRELQDNQMLTLPLFWHAMQTLLIQSTHLTEVRAQLWVKREVHRNIQIPVDFHRFRWISKSEVSILFMGWYVWTRSNALPSWRQTPRGHTLYPWLLQ